MTRIVSGKAALVSDHVANAARNRPKLIQDDRKRADLFLSLSDEYQLLIKLGQSATHGDVSMLDGLD